MNPNHNALIHHHHHSPGSDRNHPLQHQNNPNNHQFLPSLVCTFLLQQLMPLLQHQGFNPTVRPTQKQTVPVNTNFSIPSHLSEYPDRLTAYLSHYFFKSQPLLICLLNTMFDIGCIPQSAQNT